ncbi:MAG: pilus assembly protein [Dethiobacter sp.]|nr:pilus assembly protein [Dethiobacter sp.]MBS3990051.1 pilus assembly protein [Dethiobacter sp.]
MLLRCKNEQKGQALVEFALVLPLILLLLLGIVELGRVSNAYLVVIHAARHGARHAAVGATNAEIISSVNQASLPLNPGKLIISILPEQGRLAGSDVRVVVSYPLRLITPLAGNLLNNPVIVRGEITMRIE